MLTIRFKIPQEYCADFEAFLEGDRQRAAREVCVIASSMFLVFAVNDLWSIPSSLYEVWSIRIAVVCYMLFILWLSYKPLFLRQYPLIILSVFFVMGGGIEAMIYLASEHEFARYSYYAGLILVAFAIYTWAYLPLWKLVFTGFALIVFYILISICCLDMWKNEEFPILISNCFFFVNANILGVFANMHRSRAIRENFLYRQDLRCDLERTELQVIANKHCAEHDELTGLANRKKFNASLLQEIESANLNHKNIALLFIDLDGFKCINDNLGHGVGDDILCIASKRLMQCIRESDFLARIGGDEFVCILSLDAGQLDIASKVAQQMIETLEEKIVNPDVRFPLSASIGIACYPYHATTADELIHVADMQMYEAKNSGKGRHYMANVLKFGKL